MPTKFEGFAKSAPQGKPVTKAILRQEAEGGNTTEGVAVAGEPPSPRCDASVWAQDEIYDLQKFAVAIRENTETVLERILAKNEEFVRAVLAKQEELGKLHSRLVERLTDVNKRDATFLLTMVGTMVAFAVIYLLK
ncbi:MAG: hypothetical protein HY720_29360 [Planctomycetes bacterium]|nr:hypothetical protein [Planctomycetota bacterium]